PPSRVSPCLILCRDPRLPKPGYGQAPKNHLRLRRPEDLDTVGCCMKSRFFVIVIGLLLGCGHSSATSEGGGPPVEDTSDRTTAWQSGSRLHARVFDAGGGAEHFATWVDTQTGEDCSFAKAADGTIRCLPSAVDTTDSDH